MGQKGLYELLSVVLIVFWCFVAPAARQTAYIVPTQQAEFNPDNHTYNHLAYAVADPGYDLVFLVGDFRVQPALWPESQPVRRSQNLTISSFNYAEESYALLELEFLEARVIIAANVTVQLKDMAVGRARKSSGQQLPFFAGEGQESVLELHNVARLRTACANNSRDLAAALVEGFRTGPGEVGTGSNVAWVTSFKWRGQMYPDALHAEDVSTFVNPGDVTETRNFDAGYTLIQKNTTRVCLAYVDPACVSQRGVDACVIAMVDEILAAESGSGDRTRSIAKVVAPVVIAGVLLPAAVIGFLLYRRNRRRRSQQQLLPDTEKGLHAQQRQQQVALLGGKKGPGVSGSAQSNKSKRNNKEYDVGTDENDQDTDTRMPGPHGGASGTLEALAVGGAQGGWQLLACHTSPEFKDATPNDRIKLGVLLGAGSFGRVYKGRWHNMDVAVKVLQHDSTTAAAISNEVDLVMSFRHPNIVAAYHFVTWTQQPTGEGLASPKGRGRSRLMPVDEFAYDGTFNDSLTNTHTTHTTHTTSSFPRPPAVVIAGRDGSTMSSIPTVRTRSTNDPVVVTSGTLDDTTKSSNSAGSSSSNVQAMMAVLTGSKDRNTPGGTNANNSYNSTSSRTVGTLIPSGSAMARPFGVTHSRHNSQSNNSNNQVTASTRLALNPSPVPGQLGQGLEIPVTREGSEASGTGLGFNPGPVIPSPGPGSNAFRREGSSGLRFNSNGSNMINTGGSTAAVAAILAAGRQQGARSPAVSGRTVLSGSHLPPKSPAAAAAAGGAGQPGSTPFGVQSMQQQGSQQPTSPLAAASGTQQQQQQQQPSLAPSLQHLAPQQQQQQSTGVSKISNEMIVDIQTPSQPYVISDKLAAMVPNAAAAAAAPAAVAAGGPGGVDRPMAASSSSNNSAIGPHGVKLQLPASALRQPRSYSPAGNAATAAPLSPRAMTSGHTIGSSSGQQQRGSIDQPIPGFDGFTKPPAKSPYSKIGYESSTVADHHPTVEEESAVMHFVPFTPSQLLEFERSSTTGSSSSRLASMVQSPTGTTAAAAAGPTVQPSSRSQSCALVASPSGTAAAAAAAGSKPSQSSGTVSGITTPDQIQQQQQPPSGSDQISTHTPQWHVLGDFLGQKDDIKSPKAATPVATAAAATPAAADVADPAAAAAASPVVPQPANFNGAGFAGMSDLTNTNSFGSIGRPVGRIGGARQPCEAQTWLILEYCNGGTLLDLLQDGQLTGHQLPSPTNRRKHAFMLTLLSDVAAGMLYLHRRNVLHGDLKPGNILIRYESGWPYGRAAKVSDFGLSRALQVGQSHRSTRTMGTMNHTPPELLRLGRLSPAGDVYAFGIIMWEVYTGEVAFHGLHYGEVFEQVALWQKRPPIPEDMPKDYADLMTECWAADPFRRPTFDVVENSLKEMLDRVLQDEKEAQDRFVADL